MVLIVFVGMQFYRPEKNTSTGKHTAIFLAETNPSKEVTAILKESCYDCHSNNTNYPWYNNVAPFSYWLADYIKGGKRHLNFSDWETYEIKKRDHKLEELIELVDEGVMPLKEYTWTHSEAKLGEEQRKALLQWAEKTRVSYQSSL